MLFTDIEGSTALLQRLGTERYAEALDLHRRLLREAFEQHGGYEVDYEGDSFFIAFGSAADAVAAAAESQRALVAAEWPQGLPIRVRIGIHAGEPLAAPPKYVGLDVHKAARIMAAGHGGQVLLSEAMRNALRYAGGAARSRGASAEGSAPAGAAVPASDRRSAQRVSSLEDAREPAEQPSGGCDAVHWTRP